MDLAECPTLNSNFYIHGNKKALSAALFNNFSNFITFKIELVLFESFFGYRAHKIVNIFLQSWLLVTTKNSIIIQFRINKYVAVIYAGKRIKLSEI